ncbi:hypothetical protein [Nesterenkonia muleiensis]|uniref:hypothetical protein n=1 Tax=Nesterenkonia muleiensis TaxID=2282648 RepID=UPI000E71DE8C|nr:hypothetical protein [Nesterenkonia muleiensis]
MLNLPFDVLMLMTGAAEETELFMPTPWFGVIMFAALMLSLLVTLGFANKGKELPADPTSGH